METRANYILLGVFTIVMALAGIAFSLWISKAQFANVATYDIVFEGPVSGLAKGGDVRFNGIKVGDVRDLRIDEQNPQHVVARVKVDSHTPVRTSSEASLEALGLTGVNLIQLSAGDPKDALLKQNFGAPPPRIYAKPGALDDLLQQGKKIAANADVAVAQIRKLLTDENIQHLSNTIKSLDAATAALTKKGGTIEHLTSAAQSVTALSDDARGQIDKVSTNINHAAAAAADTADQAADQTLPNVTAAARDLRRLSASLDQLSGEMQDGQFSLVPGGAPAKPTVKVRP